MNDVSPLRILVFGPDFSGKSTFAGQLLYMCGRLRPEMWETLRKQKEEEGKEPNQWVESLRATEPGPLFLGRRLYRSPKYEVLIGDSASSCFFPGGHKALCVVLLVAGSHWEYETSKELIREQLLFIRRLGVGHLAVCVNKMDLTLPPYSQQRYESIRHEINSSLKDMQRDFYWGGAMGFLPISALVGDNLREASAQMPWFEAQRIPGKNGATLRCISLDQILCSFAGWEPRRRPIATLPDQSSAAWSRAWAPESKKVRLPSCRFQHLQPHPTGSSFGLREEDPSDMEPDAEWGTGGAAGGPPQGPQRSNTLWPSPQQSRPPLAFQDPLGAPPPGPLPFEYPLPWLHFPPNQDPPGQPHHPLPHHECPSTSSMLPSQVPPPHCMQPLAPVHPTPHPDPYLPHHAPEKHFPWSPRHGREDETPVVAQAFSSSQEFQFPPEPVFPERLTPPSPGQSPSTLSPGPPRSS